MLKTSKEIWDSYPDKNSYEWKNRGVHVYNTLLNHEKKTNKSYIKKESKFQKWKAN